jgi:hypothetical protein
MAKEQYLGVHYIWNYSSEEWVEEDERDESI